MLRVQILNSKEPLLGVGQDVIDMLALVCWLNRDQIVARLSEAIAAATADAGEAPLSTEDRQRAEADVGANLLTVEREQCFWTARANRRAIRGARSHLPSTKPSWRSSHPDDAPAAWHEPGACGPAGRRLTENRVARLSRATRPGRFRNARTDALATHGLGGSCLARRQRAAACLVRPNTPFPC